MEATTEKRRVSAEPNAIGHTYFVSDADPLKLYSVALVMIVDPRFSTIVSTKGIGRLDGTAERL